MNNRGMLIILSGPSGSGKGTIVRQLLEQRDDTVLSVSVTTRAPRTGEREGVHYYFKTKQEFERLIENGELLEYAEYNGDYYGTPVRPVEKCVREGKNVILEIEVQGAEKVMDKREDIVSIFITAPSLTELERRLRRRGSETDASIEQRLKIARWELTRAFRYDYVVMNDKVHSAVERIQAIIIAESMRFARMEDFILEVINNA
jgi:guanylate kinase